MKQLTFATLGSGALAAALVGIGLFVAMRLDHVLVRYPGSQYVGNKQFELVSVYNGHVHGAGIYRTGDDLTTVWRWYRVRFDLEPHNNSPSYRVRFDPELQEKNGINLRTQCVTLAKSQQRLLIRHAVHVTLCPRSYETLIYVGQSLHFGH